MSTTQQEGNDPSIERRTARVSGWKISLGGIAAAAAVLVALGAGSASGSETVATTREKAGSTSLAATRTGDGQPDRNRPNLASSFFGGRATGEAPTAFDWAARLACRLVADTDPGSKSTADRATCNRWPAHRHDASDANDEPGCDELMESELSEGDFEALFAAAFVFGLLADEFD